MPELWIGLIVVVLILITILALLGLNKRKFIESIEQRLKVYGSLEKAKNPNHGYVLKTPSESHQIMLLYAPSATEVSFNSKRHWQVFQGSKKGMLPTYDFAELSGKKVLIVYPKPRKMVKYINENEVVFVSMSLDVFGMHVISIDQIETYFG